MKDGRSPHALKVERCARDGMTVDVVAIDDQPWFAVETLPVDAQEGFAARKNCDVTWPDGSTRPASLLGELELYRALLLSENPAAADLARWVFDEVVPAIRKAGRFRLFQEGKRLGVKLDYTDDQWEWLKLHPYLIDVIPLAMAGFDSIQITHMLSYNTASGITVRKQLASLRRLGFIPAKVLPRQKQLEARIAQSLKS